MVRVKLPEMDQQTLDELVAERGIEPDLVDRLLGLVLHEYPDLGVYGAKAALQRDIEAAIKASVANESAGESLG